MQVGMKYVAH